MRTTIELDDKLFRKAKVEAAVRGVSFKSLVEDALSTSLLSSGPALKKRKRVKLPLFGSKKLGKLKIPVDIDYQSQLAEDLARYAASTRR